MGHIAQTILRNEAGSGKSVDTDKTPTQPMKEIDWEERHFQICLAMLSCPVCNMHGHPDAPILRNVIVQANKMVELLKKNSDKMEEKSGLESPRTEDPKVSQTEENQVKKKRVPQRGFSSTIIRIELFNQIWSALKKLGYDCGSDIPYFHFNECCEELNIDVDSIDIEKFSERFEVNIG